MIVHWLHNKWVIVCTYIITVDDGTGCIRCNWWRQTYTNMIEPDVDSGDLVRVIGKVSEYNERKDIIITSISQFTHTHGI